MLDVGVIFDVILLCSKTFMREKNPNQPTMTWKNIAFFRDGLPFLKIFSHMRF
jgi:hypothetical protein